MSAECDHIETTENYVKGKKSGDATDVLHAAPGKFSRGLHISLNELHMISVIPADFRRL